MATTGRLRQYNSDPYVIELHGKAAGVFAKAYHWEREARLKPIEEALKAYREYEYPDLVLPKPRKN